MTSTIDLTKTEPTVEDLFFMAGTEGTGEYKLLARSSFGAVGYRLLPGGLVRIRLEPADDDHAERIATELTRAAGWKQPGDSGQNRFSIVKRGDAALAALEHAYAWIKRGRPLVYNPTKPDYAADMLGGSA